MSNERNHPNVSFQSSSSSIQSSRRKILTYCGILFIFIHNHVCQSFPLLGHSSAIVEQQRRHHHPPPATTRTTNHRGWFFLLQAFTKKDVESTIINKNRQELIEKAKGLDSALANGKSTGSYAKVSWSNRVGSVLTPAAIPGVYMADRPFIWNSIDVGGRMAVIQLSSSSDGKKPDLFVHSPVALDEPLLQALENLGTVKHIVSPNYEHVKYAKMWADHFPLANIWGCPGMIQQEPDVPWTGEIPYGVRPLHYNGNDNGPMIKEGSYKPGVGTTNTEEVQMWDWNEIQPLHLDCEVNPFTGKPFFNEVVFFHTPSKSLLTTDVYWNYPHGAGVTNSNIVDDDIPGNSEDFGAWELAPEVGKIPFGSRAWKFGMDKIYRPFYMNLMIKSEQKKNFHEIASFISGKNPNGWQTETLIPAHGDLIRGNELVTNILSKHFNIE